MTPEVIPKPIFEAIKKWREKSRLDKHPCQVVLHVNSEGNITLADLMQKERVSSGGISTHNECLLKEKKAGEYLDAIEAKPRYT